MYIHIYLLYTRIECIYISFVGNYKCSIVLKIHRGSPLLNAALKIQTLRTLNHCTVIQIRVKF